MAWAVKIPPIIMDNHLFCGLHIGLVSGHELTERLSQRFANARVARNGLTQALALELLYRSPRQPSQGCPGP